MAVLKWNLPNDPGNMRNMIVSAACPAAAEGGVVTQEHLTNDPNDAKIIFADVFYK